MMEEVTENNFIFSLTLKSKMLTESGCLPNRHRVTGSFSQTEKQKEGNITNQHNRQSPGFTLNPTTDLIQGKLHSTVSPLPFKICRRTRKTRKILFFPCSSLRVKVVWKAKRTLHLLFFSGACQPAVQSRSELLPDTGLTWTAASSMHHFGALELLSWILLRMAQRKLWTVMRKKSEPDFLWQQSLVHYPRISRTCSVYPSFSCTHVYLEIHSNRKGN